MKGIFSAAILKIIVWDILGGPGPQYLPMQFVVELRLLGLYFESHLAASLKITIWGELGGFPLRLDFLGFPFQWIPPPADFSWISRLVLFMEFPLGGFSGLSVGGICAFSWSRWLRILLGFCGSRSPDRAT